jgi:membrane associated rhomboid family serine protease
MLPLSDTKSSGVFPFWVIIIILTNVTLFVVELTTPSLDSWIKQYALVPQNINFSYFPSLLPFLTSQFLHAGVLHILSNMLFLWVFGDNVEGKLGFLLFPLFYLLGGASGGLLQYIISPHSTIPMLGASGAVAAVLGAYFALFPHNSIKTLVPVFGFFTITEIPAFIMLLYWFITQVFSGAYSFTQVSQSTGGVAYFAHIGGFLLGYIFAKTLYSPKEEQF